MTQSDTLLIYVMYLSSLTYFLGVLFYALPIPVEGVKRWAPTLIKDSIYSLVWLSIYNDVINLANYILHKILNLSWTGYFGSIYLMSTGVTAQFVALEIIKSITMPVTSIMSFFLKSSSTTTATTTSNGISSLVSSLTGNSLNILIHQTQTIMMSLYFIIILSDVIYYGMPWLLSLGVLLMSLPFRIGRSVGATLISTVLVFYIGLPGMASLMNFIYLQGFGAFGISILIFTLASIVFSSAGLTNILLVLPIEYVSFVVAPMAYITTLIIISLGLDRVIAESANQFPLPKKLI